MAGGKPSNNSAWPNLVGLAAYGLWGRMQTLMESGQPYGHLTGLDGRSMAIAELARIVGESTRTVQGLLDKLVAAKVLDLDAGTYSDPRMVYRKTLSQTRSTAGRRGAEATNSRQPDRQRPQQTDAGLPQQNAGQVAGQSAEGTSSREDLSGSSNSNTTTATTTTSNAQARDVAVGIDPVEFERRLSMVRGHAKVQELAAIFPADDTRELLYVFLVRASANSKSNDSARVTSWIYKLRSWLDPEGAENVKATPAILATALSDYGAKGFLDDGFEITPIHFRTFVELVRSGAPRSALPVRVGSKGWKQGGKQAAAIDTAGNEAAADRLNRQLGDS